MLKLLHHDINLKGNIFILLTQFSIMNIFACKRISFKFSRISIAQDKTNITQIIGCQELLVKDYKIYINTTYGDSLV